MVLTIKGQEFQAMRMVAMDEDKDEVLRLIKNFYDPKVMEGCLDLFIKKNFDFSTKPKK